MGGVPSQAVDPVTGRYVFDDTVGHGTQTAGLIAADDNGIGIVGVTPNVRLATMKVTALSGGAQKIFPEAAVCAFVGGGARRGRRERQPRRRPGGGERSGEPGRVLLPFEPRRPAADHRRLPCGLLRAAEGRDRRRVGREHERRPDGLPAGSGCFGCRSGSLVIGVTSESALRQKTFNSTTGSARLSSTAPGGDPLQPALPPAVPVPTGQNLTTWSARAVPPPSRTDGGGYQNQFGTSAAAPYVTGVAALVVSRFGKERRGDDSARMSPHAVRSILLRTATPLACPPNPSRS